MPAVLLLAVAGELLTLPAAAWMPAMMGQSNGQCVGFISVMSLPLLAAALWALRRGASTRPALSGALAGLLSGGAAAAVYAVHCTEDSPLFYALWYVLAILGAARRSGALLGAAAAALVARRVSACKLRARCGIRSPLRYDNRPAVSTGHGRSVIR